MNEHRTIAILSAICALVFLVTAVAFGALYAPAGRDTSVVLTTVVGLAAPTLLAVVNLFKTVDNARQLNGAMDRHLENAKQIGTRAGIQAATSAVEVKKDEVTQAVREAATDAVNQFMRDEMAEAKRRPRITQGSKPPPPPAGSG